MDPKKWFEEKLTKFENDPAFIADGVLLKVANDIYQALEQQNLNQKDLANRLGCSNAYISKLLDGSQNLTLKKMVEIALALNCEFEIQIRPKRSYLRRTISYVAKETSEEYQPIKIDKDQKRSDSNFTLAA